MPEIIINEEHAKVGQWTHIEIEPEYKDDMEADVDDAECDEDVPFEGHQESDAVMDKHCDHRVPHANHAENDQR